MISIDDLVAIAEARSEFENFASFKTHKLDVLLSLSGQEQRIKTENFSEWSAVVL